MTTLAYIDENGFHAPGYAEVLDDLKAQYRAVYGDDIYLEEDSQDGESVAIEALARYDTIILAESVYRSFSPSTAKGAGLSSQVKINGIDRLESSFSTVPIRIVGQIGTTITDGMVGGDDDSVKWLLPPEVYIPVTGECLVTATASEPGDYRAAKGDICRILTPTRGWQDAVNTESVTPGAPVEQDGELRMRQKISTALPSLTVLDGTIGAVANVIGVTRCRDYENDTDTTDANGLPPHSIAIVAEGGDPEEIAHAIAVKKTPGAYPHGTTVVLTADKYGMPKYSRFFQVAHVRVRAQIRIRAHYGYLAATALKICAHVAEFISANRIGVDVLRSRLICPVANSEPVPDTRTFDIDIDDFMLAANDGPFARQNIAIPFNAAAVAAENDIHVIVMRQNDAGEWVDS